MDFPQLPVEPKSSMLTLVNTSSIQTHSATTYITVVILTCLALIFVSTVLEVFLHKLSELMNHTSRLMTPAGKARHTYGTENIWTAVPPVVRLHHLIDKTCPVQSHTPPETWHTLSENSGHSFALLRPFHSPCTLCGNGIAIGHVIRRLPCGHTFHARCVDTHLLKTYQAHNHAWLSAVTLQCPACLLFVFPTPELVIDQSRQIS